MLTKEQAGNILRALSVLPAEKVAEACDFILFLRERYGRQVEESDAWTDEDIRDFAAAALMSPELARELEEWQALGAVSWEMFP